MSGYFITVVVYAIFTLLAVLLGFASHRGSICMVKAVSEILSTRRVYMLASFGKTLLWFMLATGLAAAISPFGLAPSTAYTSGSNA